MKILLINNVFPPGFIGGYELGMSEVADYLNSRGHEVYVITSNYFVDVVGGSKSYSIERSLDCTGLSHERQRGATSDVESIFINWKNLRRIGTAIEVFEPDLVIAGNISGLGAPAIALFLEATGIPVISYYMDDVFATMRNHPHLVSVFEQIFGGLYNLSDHPVFMSRNLSNQMKLGRNFASGNTTYIPGWVKLNQVPDVEIKEDRGDSTSFVFSSRVARHKGIDLILEASSLLISRGLSNFVVDIYGAGQVTPFLQDVRRRSLDGVVNYCGMLEKREMVQRFNTYDALLFPTWEREPFGFVAVEAAAAGCVPIMTSSIGASEWFLDGVDSLKVSLSADSLAGAMASIMTMSDTQLGQLKLAAKRNAGQNLNYDYWMPQFEKLCQNILVGWDRPRTNIKAIQSSFLFLSDLLRTNLDL